jgi:hypothetical protein
MSIELKFVFWIQKKKKIVFSSIHVKLYYADSFNTICIKIKPPN